ncbi:50S ribosomal protein L25/general stress protein Ctc [Rickettsiales endosymbiont of Peranema trichophorum]|uniref:50S ribosomal protein L25/general stress protein Ctc n=1 Tax=Rickettsiales endosymbiont of Peranema trichophorum TaxID=2486577 RepID=UPI001023A737|nr:50S ribosomal protein L25/general stress protein Ctc [Rickettsiales endosymbiont of Peranema trichophorum]RZI47414.1 50S ribosomal protein L25/general stress protein Ctc [Rickettsiales endosymbiont of Peranema trichophorum]
MSSTIKLEACVKDKAGKSAAKALRKSGRLPGIIFGSQHKEIMISLPFDRFVHEYNKGNIQSKLLEIDLGDKVLTAISRDVQLDPVTDTPVHVDLQEVNKDTTIKVSVHLKVVNEDKSPGIKKGGVLNMPSRTMSVYCHPTKIPDHVVIDVSGMEIGQNVHVADLNLSSDILPVDKTNFAILSISGRSSGSTEQGRDAAAENKS